MGDAISHTNSTKGSSTGNVDSSPIIFIIIGFFIVGLVLWVFKDKLFKKKNQTLEKSETKQDPIPEPQPEPTQQETVQEPELSRLNEKFADLN